MRHEIPELDARGLRGFALKMALTVAVLFGALLPWLFGFAYPVWPWIFAAVLTAWGLAAPATLNRLYRGWMKVGIAVGTVNSKIILGLMFYLIILPAGTVMMLFGKDPLLRKLHTDEASYRVKSKPVGRDHIERPY